MMSRSHLVHEQRKPFGNRQSLVRLLQRLEQSQRQKKLLSTSKIWTCGLQFNYGKIHQLTHAKSIYTRGKLWTQWLVRRVESNKDCGFKNNRTRNQAMVDQTAKVTQMISTQSWSQIPSLIMARSLAILWVGTFPRFVGPLSTTIGGGGRDAR